MLTRPVLQTVSPASNSHTVPPATTISVAYNQTVSPTTVSTRTFAVVITVNTGTVDYSNVLTSVEGVQ